MAYLPELAEPQQTVLNTTTFLGYDHRPVIQDGAMYDMRNLCGDDLPLLSTRRRRGVIEGYDGARRVAVSDSKAYVLFSDRVKVLDAKASTGILEGKVSGAEQIVFMGTRLFVFPNNAYAYTQGKVEEGNLANSYASMGKTVTVEMCKADGSAYEDNAYTTGAEEPEDPANGDLWMDTSQDTHVLKQYNEQTEEWITVLTTFVKISCDGIHAGFEKDDVVTISGFSEASEQLSQLNGDKLLYGVGEGYIVIAGLIDQKTEVKNQTIGVDRFPPLMDYVVECDNRLWGCRYGEDRNGNFVNEIYCCKLGDPKNWRSYVGLSTDSFAATVGTDGPFTGAAVLRGSPVFFKEDCVHKVTGKIPSAFAITTTECAGVQKGSWDSLRVVNETLYYKSNTGIMAYDGSMPVLVSEALGNKRYIDAHAGVLGNTYYISMRTDPDDVASGRTNERVLMTLDTQTGLWHKQDNMYCTSFASIYNTDYEDNMFFINFDDEKLYLARHRPDLSTQEASFDWEAVFGTFGYEYPDQKYLSRFNIRMKLEAGSVARLDIQYDSDGVWHNQGIIRGTTTKTYMLPVRPRRCDHCQIRLRGEGYMQLYSIARILEMGGDG